MRYHVNPTTGDVGACRATTGPCPFGEESDHYGNFQEAVAASEARLQEIYSFDSLRRASPRPGEGSTLLVFTTKSGTKYRLHREQPERDLWTVEILKKDGTRELYPSMVVKDLRAGVGAKLHAVDDPQAFIHTSAVSTFESDALNPRLREAERLSLRTADELRLQRIAQGRPTDVPYTRAFGQATLFVLTAEDGESYRAHRERTAMGEQELYTVEHFTEDGRRRVYPGMRMLQGTVTEPALFIDSAGTALTTAPLVDVNSDLLTRTLREDERLTYSQA